MNEGKTLKENLKSLEESMHSQIDTIKRLKNPEDDINYNNEIELSNI